MELKYEKSSVCSWDCIFVVDLCGRSVCDFKSRAGKCRICGGSESLVHDLLWVMPQEKIKESEFLCQFGN